MTTPLPAAGSGAVTTGGTPRSPFRTFAAGQTVAGRYRIVRFIAQGGMGEVYEVEDLELRADVALKTVRAEMAEDQAKLERFKREIHLARRVSHPNVCRIFDIGRHQTDEANVIFLTMELLEGESLGERLQRGGRMQTDEALPIVRQMAAGLDAAHAQGIIHRDFKTGNVMLVPAVASGSTAAGAGGIRAVVTDFGLARGTASGASFAPSETGAIVGTPAYMAPEQINGDPLGPAADIYALGIVMYKMVTGELPFDDDSPFVAAIKRLTSPPPVPRVHVPDLDPRWEAAILRCLERDPADRFASAGDIVKALGGEEVAAGRKEIRAHRRRLALAGGAALLLLVVVLALVADRVRVGRKLETTAAASPSPSVAPAPGLPAPPATLRRSIAVLGFNNLSGNADFGWISTTLSEQIESELVAGEKLLVLSGEDVARMKIDLRLPETSSLSADTLARIREHSHSDFVVLGSYLATGDQGREKIRLDLRLQDTAGAGVLASIIRSGTNAELSELVSSAAAQLRERLDLGTIRPEDAKAIRAAIPANPEAIRLYAEGLDLLRTFDTLGARVRLEQAVIADPNSALAHSALASAWSGLGYDSKSKVEAKRAFDLSKGLPSEERLAVQGNYYQALKQWNEAIDTYRALWTIAPDNLDYGLRLAGVQTASGRAKEALAVTAVLRRLPPPTRDDPRIDLGEAAAALALGQFQDCLAAAGRAAARGKKNDQRLMVAEALLLESDALRNLGRPDESMASSEEARRIYAATGNSGGVARSLNNIAIVQLARGDIDAAAAANEQALAIKREHGDTTGVAASLNNFAIVYATRGDLVRAKKMWEEAIASGRATGDKGLVASSQLNIAIALAHQGDLAGARRMNEEALALFREIGDEWGVATTLASLASVRLEEGNLAGARKGSIEALAIARRIGEKSSAAQALEVQALVLESEGDLVAARARHEETLAIRSAIAEKLEAAKTRVLLARLDIEEGRAREASVAASAAAALFEHEGAYHEAEARAVLARALLESGDATGAAREIARAEGLTAKSQYAMVRSSIGIVAAQIRAGAESSAAAKELRALEASLAQATRNGWTARTLDIRLAIGSIQMRTAPAAGRSRLQTLEKDAKAAGFALVAQKAAKLLASG